MRKGEAATYPPKKANKDQLEVFNEVMSKKANPGLSNQTRADILLLAKIFIIYPVRIN